MSCMHQQPSHSVSYAVACNFVLGLCMVACKQQSGLRLPDAHHHKAACASDDLQHVTGLLMSMFVRSASWPGPVTSRLGLS